MVCRVERGPSPGRLDSALALLDAPGHHAAGDVWTYWRKPSDTIPIGPTTILARTDLVRAAPMGGLVQGEDYCASLGITTLAPGVLLPVPVYRYRQHAGQLTKSASYDELEAAAREHAWQYGRHLRSVLLTGAGAAA